MRALAVQLEVDYRLIVSAAQGDSKTKQLAAQFIPKFFKSFPGAQLPAMSAQLDLCEDEEFAVRNCNSAKRECGESFPALYALPSITVHRC